MMSPGICMENFLENVAAALEQTCAVNGDDAVLVAVSGGSDSVFLLEAIIRLKKEKKWGLGISAAHLEHGLRGEESCQDRKFVEKLCRDRNVPFVAEGVDIRTGRSHGESLEQAARNIRYAFLEKAAHKTRAKWIATGHTADDQAETLLLRIARGTGIEGLRGILPARPVSENSNVMLVRPMLDVTRAQITGYLRNRNIPWRTDSSNADTRFARNMIRARLSNVSGKDFVRLQTVLCSMALCASRDWPKIQGAALRILDPAARETDYGIEIDISALDLSLKELVPYVTREIIRKGAGDLRRITKRHVLNLQKLISDNSSVGRMELPGGVTILREYEHLTIGAPPEPPAESGEIPLQVPGEAVLPDGTVVKSELIEGDCLAKAHQSACDPSVEYADMTKLGGALTVRYRSPGDRFHPLGASGENKLKNFFIDNKVPRSWRSSVPLVVSENGIVWVVGYRLNECYKLDSTTRGAVRLSYTRFISAPRADNFSSIRS